MTEEECQKRIAEAEEQAIKKEEILYNKGLKEIYEMHQQDIAQAVREVLGRIKLKPFPMGQPKLSGYLQAVSDLSSLISEEQARLTKTN